MRTLEGRSDTQVTLVVETADVELAFAAARQPADTAAPLQDTVVQKAVADTQNALKTVAEVFVAAALHVDTAAYKHPVAAVAAGEGDDAVNEAAAVSNLPAVAAEVLCAAAEAAEGAPDSVKSQGRFQVSVFLLICGY